MKFDKKRYERLINDYEKWWNHELDRPIIQVTLEPETSKFPSGELLGMCYDTTVDPITVAKSYEEWFDDVEDGWIAAIGFRDFVYEEWKKYGIDYYLVGGAGLEIPDWRIFAPKVLFHKIDAEIRRRIGF